MLTTLPLVWPSAPVNWASTLNRGLLSWCRVLPARQGGVRWVDLATGNPHALTNGASFGSLKAPRGSAALQLDGTNDYVAGPTLTWPARQVTFSAWFYPTSVAAYACIISAANHRMDILPGSPAQLRVLWTGGDYHLGGLLVANQWRHGIGMIDGLAQTVTILLDGVVVLANEVDVAFNNTGFNGPLFFGTVEGSSGLFPGALDDLRIYQRVLTVREARALYEASVRGYPNELNWFRPPVVPSTVVAATFLPYQPWQQRGPILAM